MDILSGVKMGGSRPKYYDKAFKNVFYIGAPTIPGTASQMVMISSELEVRRIEEFIARYLSYPPI